MRKVIQTLFLLCCFGIIMTSAVAAEESGDVAESEATAQADAEAQEAQSGEEKEKKGWSGMTIFLLVFIFSVLFLISSATAMNRLGGKPPPRQEGQGPSPRRKAQTGKERFRL